MTLRALPQSSIKTFDLKTEILRLFSDSAIARHRTDNFYKSPCCTSLACWAFWRTVWAKAAVLGKTDLCGVTKGTDTSARLVTTHPSRVFVPQWHLDLVPFQKMRRSNEDPLLVMKWKAGTFKIRIQTGSTVCFVAFCKPTHLLTS